MHEFFEGQWVEVFKAGEQVDSEGNKRLWTNEDLKTIAAQYNAQHEHEAPVVIGHPLDNSPAFGWVEELKTDGKTLFAKFKQVVPEFIDAVRRGLYKKRSISLYPDLNLRHVGFLGAVPPAVKGLAEIAFNSEDAQITVYFNEEIKENEMQEIQPPEIQQNLEAKILELIEEQLKPIREMLESRETKTVTEAVPPDEAQTDEGQAEESPEVQELKTQLEHAEKQLKAVEHRLFAEKLRDEGKLKADHVERITKFCEYFEGLGSFDFSDGTKSAVEEFKDFLAGLEPKVVFSEYARKEDACLPANGCEKLDYLARELQHKRNLSYSEALRLAQAENLDLAHQAVREL